MSSPAPLPADPPAVPLDGPPRHQRANGELHIGVAPRGEASVLADLRQSGCLKARFPRPAGPWLEAVTVNSSGGVAGGDRLMTSLAVASGARASVASQAAERFYRALPEDAPAHVATRIEIAANAAAEWLPQEAILFDGAALDRTLDVSMTGDGWFLGLESLVFGRAAMGERLAALRLSDRIRLRRDGRLLLHDAVRLGNDAGTVLARAAAARGVGAVATVIAVAPNAHLLLDAVRDAWNGLPAEAGASAWDGMLVARIVAPDAASLRAAVLAALHVLRDRRPMPRVWMT